MYQLCCVDQNIVWYDHDGTNERVFSEVLTFTQLVSEISLPYVSLKIIRVGTYEK